MLSFAVVFFLHEERPKRKNLRAVGNMRRPNSWTERKFRHLNFSIILDPRSREDFWPYLRREDLEYWFIKEISNRDKEVLLLIF